MATDTTIGIFILGLFLAGALLVAVLPLLGRRRQAAGELWRLYGMQILIAGTLLLPAYLGGPVFLLALLALGARLQFEFIRLGAGPGLAPREIVAMAIGAVTVATAFLIGAGGAALLAAVGVVGLLASARLGTDTLDRRAETAVISIFFPGLLAAQLALFARLENGFAWLALVYILVEVNDSVAFLVGKSFGRRRILPRLSPGKTLEGLLAGLVAAVAVALLLNGFAFSMSWKVALGAAAIIIAGGLIGDLATSALKRRWGAKDFPALLAVHGGALDIYDSVLLAAPLFHLYTLWAVA